MSCCGGAAVEAVDEPRPRGGRAREAREARAAREEREREELAGVEDEDAPVADDFEFHRGGGARAPAPVSAVESSEDPDERFKFYCPICMLYYEEVVRMVCCAQYICETCAIGVVEGQGGGVSASAPGEEGKRVLSESLECCYCQQTGFAVAAVGRDEEAIKYEDTPAALKRPVATPTERRTPVMDRVMRGTRAIHSPLRAGASFEQMRAKMINFEQAGWVRSTDGTLTPPMGLATPPTLFSDVTGAYMLDDSELGQSLRPDNRGAFEAIAEANVAGAAARLEAEGDSDDGRLSPVSEGSAHGDPENGREAPKARGRLSSRFAESDGGGEADLPDIVE